MPSTTARAMLLHMQKLARAVVEGVLAGLRGERPANVLNPEIYQGR